MSRIFVHEERCKGCLLCTTVCPEEALEQSERFNPNGFKVVQQNQQSECTGCAFCAEICPDYAITVFRKKKSAQETAT
ncbi:MAG: 4Fe-4S dicluster domain-containing protein [Desulfohalobiaceae bacterium]|nr:4Fe-4S dicluster domain-containing protein [Desulfohalobiaceae bacterium]